MANEPYTAGSDLRSRTVAANAPIALFVYNRPLHTRQTVETLRANERAQHSDLFIYSDAPKNGSAASGVQRVREYLKSIDGFKSVSITEREHNLGLANSIIDGVTRLCEQFGQAIVVEDDLVSSPYFLRYMNDALALYCNSPEVMHISGSTYPVRENSSVNSYFLRLPLCWGWATWQRAWTYFAKDIRIMQRFDRQMIGRFNFDGTFPNYWEQLELNRDGKIDTWFVFWYATVFLRHGLVLFPRQSLLKNIGNDGTGVHSGTTDDFDVEVSSTPVKLEPIPLEESVEAFARHKSYFQSLRPSLRSRVLRKVARIVRGTP